MLIKLASLRGSEPLEAAVLRSQEAGRKYINVASRLLDSEGEAIKGKKRRSAGRAKKR